MLQRWIDFWVSPKKTLYQVSKAHFNDAFAIMGIYIGLRLLAGSTQVYSWMVLAPHAPGAAFRKVYRYIWDQSRYDIWILLGVSLLFWSFSRFILKRRVPLAGALNVVSYCAWPMLVWICINISLLRLGVDGWWGAHHPVDELRALVVDKRVSLFRFIVKCTLAYAPAACFLGAWMLSQFRHRKMGAETKEHSQGAEPLPWLRTGVASLVSLMGAAALVLSMHHLVSNQEQFSPVVPGRPLPKMELPVLPTAANLQQKTLTAQELKGKVVLLDFWATWCPPCMRALPELEKLHRKYKGKGLAVVGINRQPYARSMVLAKIQSLDLTFTQLLDQKTGAADGFGERMGVQSLPTSFLLDRTGQIRKIHIGYTSMDVLDREIQNLLNPSDKTPPTP